MQPYAGRAGGKTIGGGGGGAAGGKGGGRQQDAAAAEVQRQALAAWASGGLPREYKKVRRGAWQSGAFMLRGWVQAACVWGRNTDGMVRSVCYDQHTCAVRAALATQCKRPSCTFLLSPMCRSA